MIEQLRVIGEHITPSDGLKAYVTSKIGKLDKFLPRRARRNVHADVVLREEKGHRYSDDTVEVLLYVPNQCLKAQASSDNMQAAIDAVEPKLRQQIERYRNEHSPRFYRHIMRRFGERFA